jgi:hypothetical protein
VNFTAGEGLSIFACFEGVIRMGIKKKEKEAAAVAVAAENYTLFPQSLKFLSCYSNFELCEEASSF